MTIPIRSLEHIREALTAMPEAEAVDRSFAAAEVLLCEGKHSDWVSLVIQG